jgi:thiamine-phosphate pyrophosphorylase
MSTYLFRLLDANFNRASEGLRVLEDVARFIAEDAALSRELRAMRHSLAELAQPLDVRLLSSRDSITDVGRESGMRVGGERDLISVIRANAKRAEESLRALEELARLPELQPSLDAAIIERLRYASYELEKQLSGRVLRTERAALVCGLYVVVDRQAAGSRSLNSLASEAIDGGATTIQLRDKVGERSEVYHEALELNAICAAKRALFIVNDYADVAVAVGAGGLHIGQEDLPVDIVRRLLPIDMVVGVSCGNSQDVRRALDEGADYIAVGALFPTAQKTGVVPTGLDIVTSARAQVGKVPLVAIGGINLHNVESVIDAGADGAAVIGAVIMQPDVRKAAEEMAAAIRVAGERGQQDEQKPD